jgi:hypothetical protein
MHQRQDTNQAPPTPPPRLPYSKEVSDAITKVTGLAHTKRTAKDIQAWFNRADFDKRCELHAPPSHTPRAPCPCGPLPQ